MKTADEARIKSAICQNNSSYLKQFIDDFSINYILLSEDNDSLLNYAVSDPKSDAYKRLIEWGADLNCRNLEGETILHAAVYSGRINRVRDMINQENVNKTDKNGVSPLLLSVGLEQKRIPLYLIKNGAKIDVHDNEGNLPIHLASFLGDLNLVKALFESGSPLDRKTARGNLPLALAVNENRREVVKYLYSLMY